MVRWAFAVAAGLILLGVTFAGCFGGDLDEDDPVLLQERPDWGFAVREDDGSPLDVHDWFLLETEATPEGSVVAFIVRVPENHTTEKSGSVIADWRIFPFVDDPEQVETWGVVAFEEHEGPDGVTLSRGTGYGSYPIQSSRTQFTTTSDTFDPPRFEPRSLGPRVPDDGNETFVRLVLWARGEGEKLALAVGPSRIPEEPRDPDARGSSSPVQTSRSKTWDPTESNRTGILLQPMARGSGVSIGGFTISFQNYARVHSFSGDMDLDLDLEFDDPGLPGMIAYEATAHAGLGTDRGWSHVMGSMGANVGSTEYSLALDHFGGSFMREGELFAPLLAQAESGESQPQLAVFQIVSEGEGPSDLRFRLRGSDATFHPALYNVDAWMSVLEFGVTLEELFGVPALQESLLERPESFSPAPMRHGSMAENTPPGEFLGPT